MATRKQRRRREKEHRHDYVLVDAAGNEIEPTRSEERGSARPRSKAAAKPVSGGRVAQPPSWRKVIKRGLIFAPIFLATILLLGGGGLTLADAVVQTVFLLIVFVPFSYLMDRFVWRMQVKRRARGG